MGSGGGGVITTRNIRKAVRKFGWQLQEFNEGRQIRINGVIDFWPSTQKCIVVKTREVRHFDSVEHLNSLLPPSKVEAKPVVMRRTMEELTVASKAFWNAAVPR
jgi:hypothetical protein